MDGFGFLCPPASKIQLWVEGACWFQPVCLWVGAVSITLCIWSRILKFHIWNKHEKISGPIFSVRLVVAVKPLFRLLHCKPMEPCEQNIWRTAWARIMIYIRKKHHVSFYEHIFWMNCILSSFYFSLIKLFSETWSVVYKGVSMWKPPRCSNQYGRQLPSWILKN